MIVADTSVIYALLDRADSWHERIASWYREHLPDFATTPLVLAEMEHLALACAGRSATEAWRRDVTEGAYAVEWWDDAARESVEIAERYAEIGVDMTDASLAALAERLGTADIATLDERHFRSMRSPGGEPFRLLPLDA